MARSERRVPEILDLSLVKKSAALCKNAADDKSKEMYMRIGTVFEEGAILLGTVPAVLDEDGDKPTDIETVADCVGEAELPPVVEDVALGVGDEVALPLVPVVGEPVAVIFTVVKTELVAEGVAVPDGVRSLVAEGVARVGVLEGDPAVRLGDTEEVGVIARVGVTVSVDTAIERERVGDVDGDAPPMEGERVGVVDCDAQRENVGDAVSVDKAIERVGVVDCDAQRENVGEAERVFEFEVVPERVREGVGVGVGDVDFDAQKENVVEVERVLEPEVVAVRVREAVTVRLGDIDGDAPLESAEVGEADNCALTSATIERILRIRCFIMNLVRYVSYEREG